MMKGATSEEPIKKLGKTYNVLDFCRNLEIAWELVTEVCMVNAWWKLITGISYWEDKDEFVSDLVLILQRVPGCETVTIQELSLWMRRDDALPIWRQFKTEPTDLGDSSSAIEVEEMLHDIKSEEGNNGGDVSCIPTAQETFAAIKMLYEWREALDEYKPRDLYHLRHIHRVALDVVMKETQSERND